MIYRMKLADSVDEMTFDLLEVPIEDKDIEGATDNTTIDGNVFTDYLWLKKQFVQKWSLMCKDDYTRLRGFYTRQWENAEAPTYTLFVGEEGRSETLTASGSAFQIQNGTQYDAPLTLTELTGNATQNGTPTPDAPVAVQTVSGEQTITISDGTNTQEYTIDLGSIELAKIGTYQDRIYKNAGKWYVEKQVGKVVLDGTNGTYSKPSTNRFNIDIALDYTQHAGDMFYMSDTYEAYAQATNNSAFNTLVANTSFGFGLSSATSTIRIKDTNYNVLNDYKTWLGSHPVSIYYALATPTTTEITGNTLLSQLNFIANLCGGTNNIMLVGTGAQGEIGVEYTLTYVREQTIIPETTVRLTLTDGGVINTCECRQNVQLTMRETVQ